MRDKHIITGGCSFTNCGKSWPYHIDQEKYGWVHNVATPGAGQAYITRSVIHQVENILNRNEYLVLLLYIHLKQID